MPSTSKGLALTAHKPAVPTVPGIDPAAGTASHRPALPRRIPCAALSKVLDTDRVWAIEADPEMLRLVLERLRRL